MIVSGCLTLEPGNCLGYQIFNFLDGKNWRNEMMNREYNGLGAHDIMGIKRVNELIDEEKIDG